MSASAHPLTGAHPLARPYLAASALCPLSPPHASLFEGVGGQLTSAHERFFVHERPLYRASGEGEHCLAHILKVERTTEEALEALASATGEALGVELKVDDLGYAGRKDRDALTTQWVSLPCAPERVSSQDPNVVVLSATAHESKLKLGHLAGNLFSLYLSNLTHPERLNEGLEALRAGVPNYFGPQRFGKPWYATPLEGSAHPTNAEGRYVQDPTNPAQDNVDRALQTLTHGLPRGKRFNKRLHKLTLSALQSALFNLWLGERLRDGLINKVIEGDVCRKVGGGTFTSTDPATDTARLLAGELDVLGPLLGPKLFPAHGEAKAREEALYEQWGVGDALRAKLGKSWRGDRRPMTLRPLGLTARLERDPESGAQGVWLTFALPSGAFATTIAGFLLTPHALFRRAESE